MLRYQSCEGEAIATLRLSAMRGHATPKRRDYAGTLPRVWDRIRFQPTNFLITGNPDSLILPYTSASLRLIPYDKSSSSNIGIACQHI
jgi:hypothetical protein